MDYPDLIKNIDPSTGFSDSVLEDLARIKTNHRHGFWTAELNGFAACYRRLLYFPRWLPLPVMSEHGLALDPSPLNSELEHGAPYFFYWSPLKAYGFRKKNEKYPRATKNIKIPCPIYELASGREIRGGTAKENRRVKKVLFFLPHGTEKLEIYEWPIEDYLDELRSVIGVDIEIYFCVHHHEIRKGVHKKLRKFGIPLVTAGFSGDYNFADYLTALISEFDVTAANLFSTSVVWSVSCGVPHLLLKRKVLAKNFDDNLPVSNGEKFDFVWRASHKRYMALVDELFSSPHKVSERQLRWLEKHGVRQVSVRERQLMFIVIWWSFLQMLPRYFLAALKRSVSWVYS